MVCFESFLSRGSDDCKANATSRRDSRFKVVPNAKWNATHDTLFHEGTGGGTKCGFYEPYTQFFWEQSKQMRRVGAGLQEPTGANARARVKYGPHERICQSLQMAPWRGWVLMELQLLGTRNKCN
jgi:hypothetical protein